jgi:transcriptional regulator with XRE-family HTH domain
MPDIGETLRDARMRARIDVSEIEDKTKIRAKYLRALENEEWSLLPGPTFVKSFLRTYAQALGLDGKALVEQYRTSYERPTDAALEPIVPASQRSRPRAAGARTPPRPSRGYLALVGVIVVVIALLIWGIASGGSGSKSSKNSAATKHRASAAHKSGASATRPPASAVPAGFVYLSIEATARVYVCLLGDGGHKLVPGIELAAGEKTSTYRAHRFRLNLGNNSVVMRLDGTIRPVPASNEAIGYTITKATGRRRLPASQLPSCA